LEKKIIQTISAYFPDPRDMQAVIRAARRARKSPSAFMRDAALAAAMQCPTCGQVHKKSAA
jgi:hypothetical protein